MAKKTKPKWGFEQEHNGADFAKRQAELDFEWLGQQIGSNGAEDPETIERELLTMLSPFYGTQFDEPAPNF